MGNNFKTKYEQFLETYNGGQCKMVLIKNVATTSKINHFLKAQHSIISNKVIDEGVQPHLPYLHNKLSSTRLTLRKVNLFPHLQ
jgi:hypothetical protein